MRKSHTQLRARKILVVNICAIVLMQAAFSFVFPWWHPDAEFRVHKEVLQNRLSEHPDQSAFVMVGSSRVSFGFDPESLSPLTDADGKQVIAFNFGHFNAGPTSNLLTVDRLLRSNIKPRWIMVEVTPSLCFCDWSGFVHDSSWGDIKTVSNYYSIRKFGGSVLRQYLLLPWFQHRGDLQEHYLQETQEERRDLKITSYGWWLGVGEQISPGHRLEITEHQRIVFGENLSGAMHIEPASAAALRELLTLCRKEGIHVALIMMPEGNTFRSWYSPSAEAEFQELMGNITAEFQVPVFDTREWFDDSYFSDSHHLMRPGAREFTRRFEGEILRPFLSGQSSMARQVRSKDSGPPVR